MVNVVPHRTSCELIKFRSYVVAEDSLDDVQESPPTKRLRLDEDASRDHGLQSQENGDASCSRRAVDIMAEAHRFAKLIACTLLDP
jgi:hypothetical protein